MGAGMVRAPSAYWIVPSRPTFSPAAWWIARVRYAVVLFPFVPVIPITFIRIVLPLSAPGVVTAALFSFVFAWNEYLFALMLTNIDAITMPVYIAGQNSTRGTEWWYISALTLLSVGPVLLLGLLLQRYITRGLVAGALKG